MKKKVALFASIAGLMVIAGFALERYVVDPLRLQAILSTSLRPAPGWLVGQRVPDWSVEPQGSTTQIQLASLFTSSPGLVVFAASNCGVCDDLFKELGQYTRARYNKNVSVIWSQIDGVSEQKIDQFQLRDFSHYGLVGPAINWPWPTIWVVSATGTVLFDKRGLGTGVLQAAFDVLGQVANGSNDGSP